MVDARLIAARLDRIVSERSLLEHPFYRAWVDGTLTLEDLSFYSQQYWRQVEAFPGYLNSIARNAPEGKVHDIVIENLRDEVDGDHAGLWLAFAEAVGAGRDEVFASIPTPETKECVERFTSGAGGSSAFALGMLYGYESQTPAVAKTKSEGLRDRYGIEGEGLDYFELHGELDVQHASELAEAIAEVVDGDDAMAEVEAGAKAGAEAVWTLLDGVARERGISVPA